MSFYGSMKVAYVNAETEAKLQKKLRELEIKHDAMIKVINVYKSGSGYTAWYYHDFQRAGIPQKQEITSEGVQTVKKATKKKVSKKVSKKGS